MKKIDKKINQIFNAFEASNKAEQKKLTLTPFGSCQYSTAYFTFIFITDLIACMGYKRFCLAFGMTHDKKIPLKTLEAQLYQGELENLQTQKTDNPDNWDETDEQDLQELLDHKSKRFTLSEYFQYLKDHSADLWSAFLSPEYFLPNYIITDPGTKTPVSGPIFNQMAQSENYNMGLALALLTYHYKQSDVADYADFDT